MELVKTVSLSSEPSRRPLNRAENIVRDMQRQKIRVCEICQHPFVAHQKYRLFCDICKEHSERYRFAEWFPA